MEKQPSHLERNAQNGRLVYDKIVEGLTFTAAVLRTGVFSACEYRQNADALMTTLRMLESNPDNSLRIEKAREEVRDAIKRFRYLGSGRRAREIMYELWSPICDDDVTTADNPLVRAAQVHYLSPIDGNAAKITRIPKNAKHDGN